MEGDALIGVALFGMGRLGSFYFDYLAQHPGINLYYIVRRNILEGHNRIKSSKSPSTVITNDLNTVIQDPRVKAVIVVSSTESHEEIVTKALTSGKAVFCEKPITQTEESTRKLYELAEANHLPLFCAFQRRFDTSFEELYKKVKEDAIGKVFTVKSTSRDPQYPDVTYLRSSGGFFFDSTVHDFDQLLWITGDEPVSVYAVGHAHNPEIAGIGDVDNIAVTVKFKRGAIGIIDQCRQAVYGYDQRLEVLGEHGMLTIDNTQATNVHHYGIQANTSPQVPSHWLIRYKDAYQKEIDHFINVVRGKEDICVKKDEVLWGLRLAKAAQKSLESHTEVKLG